MTSAGPRGRGREVAFLVFAIVVALVAVGGTLWVFLGEGGGESSVDELAASPIAREFRPPRDYELATLRREHQFDCRSDDRACARSYLGDITSEYGPRPRWRCSAASAATAGSRRRWTTTSSPTRSGGGRPSASASTSRHSPSARTPSTTAARTATSRRCSAQAGTPEDAAGAICESLAGLTRRHGALLLLPRRRPRRDDGGGLRPRRLARHLQRARRHDRDRRGAGRASSWRTSTVPCAGRRARASSSRPGRWHRATRVEERYRHQCFINHAGWLVHVAGSDLEAGCAAVPRAPAGEYVAICMQSLGLMVTNPDVAGGAGDGAAAGVRRDRVGALLDVPGGVPA